MHKGLRQRSIEPCRIAVELRETRAASSRPRREERFDEIAAHSRMLAATVCPSRPRPTPTLRSADGSNGEVSEPELQQTQRGMGCVFKPASPVSRSPFLNVCAAFVAHAR